MRTFHVIGKRGKAEIWMEMGVWLYRTFTRHCGWSKPAFAWSQAIALERAWDAVLPELNPRTGKMV